jgi:hypothetical protein
MGLWSDEPPDVHARAARRWTRPPGPGPSDRSVIDQESPLERSALKFAARCHARRRRTSDGAPFIEHPLEVAALLRDAGCPDVVVAAGLLHDVLGDTRAGPTELTARFGADVMRIVRAVTEDASVRGYRRRKRLLRAQVRVADGDAALVLAADTISKVREISHHARRDDDRARFDTVRRVRGRNLQDHADELRVEHCRESLAMLQEIAPRHPLVVALAEELDRCPIGLRGGASRPLG